MQETTSLHPGQDESRAPGDGSFGGEGVTGEELALTGYSAQPMGLGERPTWGAWGQALSDVSKALLSSNRVETLTARTRTVAITSPGSLWLLRLRAVRLGYLEGIGFLQPEPGSS